MATYEGKDYSSLWELRWANKNLIFPNDSPEALKLLGITVTEVPDPAPDIEAVRTSKLDELEAAFMKWREEDAVITSKLGFKADSDTRAMMDVDGLVTQLSSLPEASRSTVAFMDAENNPHQLALDQLKALQLEIIEEGQRAYGVKWQYRTEVLAATDVAALQAMSFDFTPGEAA